MEIELRKAELIQTLENALKENEQQNYKIWAKYVEKIGEYFRYIKNLDPTAMKKRKDPPYLRLEQTQNIWQTLDVLKLHTKETVTMDDNEYHSLLEGVHHIRAGAVNAIMALEETAY